MQAQYYTWWSLLYHQAEKDSYPSGISSKINVLIHCVVDQKPQGVESDLYHYPVQLQFSISAQAFFKNELP